MGGVLSTGQGFQDNALAGMRRATDLETQRKATNTQAVNAEKAQKISAISSGAGVGAAAGAAYGGTSGGPYGAVIGGIAGYLLSEVF